MTSEWDGLCRTFDEFMQGFKDKGSADNNLFSVIQFGSNARIIFKALPAN